MSDRAKKSNLCYLVFHGGTKVCRALFEKLVKDHKPPEEDAETWTVDKFLQIKKTMIQSKLSSGKKLILYPGAQRKTDMQKWDISILCLILMEPCVLSPVHFPVIRMYVDQIRKQRNKIAHMLDSDIDDNAYQCIFEKLKVCFEKIVLEVKDDGLKTTIENILTELNTGSIPSDELIRVEEAIRQSSKDVIEEVIHQGVETRTVLQKDNQEVSRRLDKLTNDVEEILRVMKGKVPVEIPIPGINIKVPMQNCTHQAEKAIVKVLNHEVEDDCDLPQKDMDNLKCTINELQEEFKGKGRPISSAEVGCINLHIQCSSTLSLLYLIRDYLNGSLDESLKKLEKAARSLDGCEDLRLEAVLYEDEVLRILSDLDFGELFRLAKSVPAASDLPIQSESLENASDEKASTEDVYDTKALVMDTKAELMQMKDFLVNLKQQRENQGRITKIVETMFGKVYLGADDQETIDQAEAHLLEASNNSIAKKEPTDISHQALQDKVDLVVRDIENLDVRVEGVDKGANLYENVINELQEKGCEKVVQFNLSCAGVNGLLHVLEVFEEGKATNYLNELSKALSDSVGKHVALHTSIDMDQMKNAIQNLKDQFRT